LRKLLAQHAFSIACGYPDANDSDRLSADPIHNMRLDADLASRPTLSRFENSIRPQELCRLSEALAARVIERHAERLYGRAHLLTIDLDPTDDSPPGAHLTSKPGTFCCPRHHRPQSHHRSLASAVFMNKAGQRRNKTQRHFIPPP
jgi:hypothetical protein